MDLEGRTGHLDPNIYWASKLNFPTERSNPDGKSLATKIAFASLHLMASMDAEAELDEMLSYVAPTEGPSAFHIDLIL